MKIKLTTDDPFTGKETIIIKDSDRGYTSPITEKCLDIFDDFAVTKITILLDIPMVMKYERLDEINE